LKIRTPVLLFFIMLSGLVPASAQMPNIPHYDIKLTRLAEILGSLHYLRNLCGETSMQWRNRMNQIIEAEKPNESRKARFYAAFNNAYNALSERYYECTPAAAEAIKRYGKEGATLSQDLVNRYGN